MTSRLSWVNRTTTCSFKFPKYFSWGWNTWPGFSVRAPKDAAPPHLSPGCVSESVRSVPKSACRRSAHVRLGRASGVLFQTVHRSVTNKPALGSVLEIAASFPGFRFHLSALRQGFRTFNHVEFAQEHAAERHCGALGADYYICRGSRGGSRRALFLGA